MMVNILGLDAQALAGFVADIGEKPLRAKQLMRWVHRAREDDFRAMSDLALALREKLVETAVVDPPRLISDSVSEDGTRKWLYDIGNANAVETVFIPEPGRGTLCVSTQAGCTLACGFCSTGRQGFNRNLTAAEIIGQMWFASRALQARGAGASARTDTSREQRAAAKEERIITNVVMMGMGEPLLNFDNVLPALRLMLDDHAYGLSRRRVTVSTAGIVPLIDRLREECPVALAVSLHAPNDDLRDRLMPINRKYPLRELLGACVRYLERAPRDFVTFEYVMLAGVNDGLEHARQLARLLAEVPSKVNLIPFNPFPASGFARPGREAVRRFNEVLNTAGIVTTTRRTRGEDIDAACGQLAGRIRDRTHRVVRLERAL